MAASVVDELSALLEQALQIEVPGPHTDLIDRGLLDSLQLVQLLLQIEERMGARIPLDEVDLEDLRSIGRLAALIEARR
jgi:acyl carrier protein